MQWVVEDCLCLDANRIAKMGIFTRRWCSASLRWESGANIEVMYRGDCCELDLRYNLNGEPNPQTICISKVACHFGGYRYYFKCPGCRSRRYKLHCASSGFYCRDCYRLPYYSQECGYIEGITHKIHRLEAKLDKLPKHTRAKTLDRLETKLECAEREWSYSMITRFGLVETRLLGLDMG